VPVVSHPDSSQFHQARVTAPCYNIMQHACTYNIRKCKHNLTDTVSELSQCREARSGSLHFCPCAADDTD